MKARNFTALFVLLVFVFCLTFLPSIAIAQEEKQEEQETQVEEKIIIPQPVKLALQEGLAQRQGRQDIPFSLIKHYYLPARENFHSIFLFKMKNVDLGFVPQPSEVVEEKTAEEKIEEEKKEEAPTTPETEALPVQLLARLHVFLQFHHLKEKEPGEIFKEVYIPFNSQVESTSFDPEKEEIYSTGYPLPPGDYLMSMAITSFDLQRIGTYYFEFSLPDTKLFAEELGTTPLLFVKNFKEMDAPETMAEIHQGFFTYSILQIEPKIDNVFAQGENLDILFFIFGPQPNEEGKYDIGVNYEVLKEEERIIRFEAITYPSPLVSQPLPMKRTYLIKSEEGEKKERKDLDPGIYKLSIQIKDNISGKSLNQNVDFEIK